jgi:hypothetical protein
MDPAVDVASLSAPARRVLDAASPAPLRQMASKGVVPGVKPGEALTIVALLSESDDEGISATARATLAKLPTPLLNGALAGDLPPGVLSLLAPLYARDAAIAEKFLAHPAIPPQAVAAMAVLASEPVAELVATNEQRLLAHPEIIEKLYMNKATRMSTADRVLELAVRNKIELKGIPAFKEAAAAIGHELIVEPSPEPTPDDLLFQQAEEAAAQATLDASVEDTHRLDEETGEEKVDEKFLPLHARRSTAPRPRYEPPRRAGRHQEPCHPGERGRPHQREPLRQRGRAARHRARPRMDALAPDQAEPGPEPAHALRIRREAHRASSGARA